MIRLLGLILIIFAGLSCSTQKGMDKPHNSVVYIDSSEYDITIIDPDFDRWYMLRYSPALERSNEYYRQRNVIASTNWNNYLMRNRYNRVISSYINYHPGIDYGLQVNSKLYWYFRYIQETYRIPLLR